MAEAEYKFKYGNLCGIKVNDCCLEHMYIRSERAI